MKLKFLKLGSTLSAALALLCAAPAQAVERQTLDQDEATTLRQHPGLAQRDGARLILRAGKGRTLQFSSKNACTGPEDCELYHFGGLSPDGGFLIVRQQLWEGSTVYWISRRDGRNYEVYRNPEPSPGGHYIVAANPSEAYDFNGVVVWQISHGALIKRFSETPTTYALYEFIAWQDAHTVRLKRSTHEPQACAGSSMAETDVLLKRQGNGRWKILPPEAGSLRCL